MLKYFADKRI